jgi:hypothetical protein
MFLIQDLVAPHHVLVLVVVLEVSARERGSPQERGSRTRRSRGKYPYRQRAPEEPGPEAQLNTRLAGVPSPLLPAYRAADSAPRPRCV